MSPVGDSAGALADRLPRTSEDEPLRGAFLSERSGLPRASGEGPLRSTRSARLLSGDVPDFCQWEVRS